MSDKEIYEILASDYLLQIRFDFRGILIVIFVFSCLLYIFENQKRGSPHFDFQKPVEVEIKK